MTERPIPLSSYTTVAIQTALGAAPDRAAIQRNLERVVGLIGGAVWAYAHWGYPVKLVALPEFCLQGIPYFSHEELERHDVLILACGTVLEADEAYPGLTMVAPRPHDSCGQLSRPASARAYARAGCAS